MKKNWMASVMADYFTLLFPSSSSTLQILATIKQAVFIQTCSVCPGEELIDRKRRHSAIKKRGEKTRDEARLKEEWKVPVNGGIDGD